MFNYIEGVLSSGLQLFLFYRPLAETLVKNLPPLMILVLCKLLLYFKNNSMLMKYKRAI